MTLLECPSSEVSKLIAYTDESGNTGNHLFDKSQPVFWTGTLLSTCDLDNDLKHIFERWCDELIVSELHGNELGLNRIENIAEELQNLILEYNLKFIFSLVEKQHVATMKFVDAIIDSGLNKAVSPIHYNLRPLRLPLAYIIDLNFSPRNREQFWDAYAKKDVDSFCQIISRVRWNILNKTYDPRAKELLIEAMDWALDNPKVLFDFKRAGLDSPNMVAFSLLLYNLNLIVRNSGQRVKTFIHDEQNEFAKYIRIMFAHFKDTTFSLDPFGSIIDLEEIDIYDCDVDFIASNETVGLQLVDIVMWLIKRFIEGKFDNRFKSCTRLLQTILEISFISQFSRKQLEEEVGEIMVKLNQLPLTEDQLNKGKLLLQQVEEKRKDSLLDKL